MSPRFHNAFRAVAAAAVLAFAPPALVPALAQDVDLEMRIQRLENQLRQLTGQNEELQYRNRQLEERLRQLGAAPPGAQQPPATAVQPNVAAAPPAPANPGYRQPAYPQQGGYPPQQPGYQQPAYPQQQGVPEPQIAAPAPIVQEPAQPGAGNRRRGDAFDPTQNPNAPGAPKALGGGQMPLSSQAAVGAPGGRGPGEPLDLGSVSPRPPGAPAAPVQAPTAALATLPPSATPRDEFDLGIGYMQRKDYALAEETMKNFAQKHPKDPMIADSKYWLGESHFQRQQYREAAQAFLGVTSDHEKSAKAPDAMLRLGQSLAALKEKEAACAAFGAVLQKYPRASAGVKAAVDREQKRVKC
ncbi:tol-pal system protein YbgF [Bradyrhizobium sp.]|uniref:tol-pal system protein YbgF n=1 Tax=Bradyrhizobium sp. TaxID=376 RepID=UPI004037CAEE